VISESDLQTLGFLSNEELAPWINWSTLGPPFYRGFAAHGPTRLIKPPALKSLKIRRFGHALAEAYQADTLFGIQASAKLENELMLVSLLRGKVRRSAFVVDPWRPALDRIHLGARLQKLTKCFIPYSEAYAVLSRKDPDLYHYLPFGIDTDAFAAQGGDRDIDIFWMGRRYEPLHQAILRHCDEHGLVYMFRERTGFLNSAAEIGALAGRSRYFVVTPPDLDGADRTGGFSPLVMRYLEGLSAGCRLLGVLPRSGEFEKLLPVSAILQVKPDGTDFEEQYAADRNHEEGWAAVKNACAVVREHHSWSARAKEIRAVLSG